ncbi:MAG TPA: glutaredoxin domain-containing protein [Caulobacteraceae bacterium]|nr:glutaredoxin domain-containing protein [Caulobacteraceae bacterium]
MSDATTINPAHDFIARTVAEHPVVLFMKGTPQFPQCGFSALACQVLNACGVQEFHTVNVLADVLGGQLHALALETAAP